eukprot:INCI17675.4.p1 GENE.INCI17675.4~~INCI17675.4.p1  ORF type:complete len:1055 (-),score=135.03 INCI17675.4:941-3958(-)
MAAGTGVSESPALLREHLLRHNAWQEVWRANAGERKRLSAAQRLALHAPKIQNQVVEAPDNCRSFWDSALFAIDCLVQAIHDGILAASGCGAGAPPLLGRGSLFPPDFQATIAAVISRTEGVRDGLSVRCAFVGIVRGVLSDVVVPDIEQFGPPGSGKRLERFGQWWEAFKVFSEFTRRFLQYHDRDTVPAAADASLLFQQRRTLGQGTGSGNSGRNPDPPRVESLSATSIRAWRDLVFVPLVRNDSAFVASLWEVIRRDRDEGNEGSPLFISLVENVMESAKAAGLASHPEFYRIQHFVDPALVNRRAQFTLMNYIPLIASYLREPPAFIDRAVVQPRDSIKQISEAGPWEGLCGFFYWELVQEFLQESRAYFRGKLVEWINDGIPAPTHSEQTHHNSIGDEADSTSKIGPCQSAPAAPITLTSYVKVVARFKKSERARVHRYFDADMTWPLVNELLVEEFFLAPNRDGRQLLTLGGPSESLGALLEQQRLGDLREIFKVLHWTQTVLNPEWPSPRTVTSSALKVPSSSKGPQKRKQASRSFDHEVRKTSRKDDNGDPRPAGVEAPAAGDSDENQTCGLQPLLHAFALYAKKRCVQVLRKHIPASQPTQSGHKGGVVSSESTSQSHNIQAIDLVLDLIAAMRDLESVIAQFEERSLPFQAACTNSFESVVNNKRICFAQALAEFLDGVIRGSLPLNGVSSDQNTQFLTDFFGTSGGDGRQPSSAPAPSTTPLDLCTQTIKLFTFLYDKDVFQEHYNKLLRRRLLANRADAYNFSSSAELEGAILGLLLQQQGIGFVSRMQRMIDDVESDTARANDMQFRRWFGDCRQLAAGTGGVEAGSSTDDATYSVSAASAQLKGFASVPSSVGVLTLTESVWPPREGYSAVGGLLKRVAPPLRAIGDAYARFYREQFPARTLTNHWEETRVVLQAKFPKEAPTTTVDSVPEKTKKKKKSHGAICYEFHVSALQATLLNAFTQRRKVQCALWHSLCPCQLAKCVYSRGVHGL